MAEEVGKREKHAFLSHAHVDKTQADMLYDFLTRVAGIPVWYDTDDLPPGAAFAGLIRGHREQPRRDHPALS